MKKLGILLAILVVALVGVTGCGKKEEKNYLKEITLTEYFELKDQKENVLVYIDSNDDVSAQFRKSLNTILNDLDVEVKYLDTTKFKNEEETMKFMNADDYTKEGYEVPTLVHLKKGNIDVYTTGYTKDETIRSFVRANS